MKLAASPGMMLLGIWLILYGLLPLGNINFAGRDTFLNVLAILAGVFILRSK